jgi:hypothetical protein
VPQQESPPLSPTLEQFSSYQLTYDYFNEELFDGDLKQCHLNFSRRAASGVYFRPNYWKRQNGELLHEIGLNPSFLGKPFSEVMALLARGMGFQWQYDFGTPSPSTGYCNRELTEKLKAIGLQLTDTGEFGGRETGKWLRHIIIPGERFDQAVQAMPEEYKLPWISESIRIIKRPKDKISYTCPECLAQVWGKAGLAFGCMCDRKSGEKWIPECEEEV